MRSLRGLHKLLFYRYYKWSYDRYGDYDEPEFSALCWVSLLTNVNFITVLILFERLFSVEIIETLFPNKLWKIAQMLCVFLFNYFLLYYKGKYRAVIAEQEELGKVRRKSENIIVTVYIIGTPVMLVLAVICPSL